MSNRTVADDLKQNRSLALDRQKVFTSMKLPHHHIASFKFPIKFQDRDRAVYNQRKISIISGKEFRTLGHRADMFRGQLGTLRLM